MEISIISDIFTVFLLALLRLGRILPGFFVTVLPHMVGELRPSMIDATVKKYCEHHTERPKRLWRIH